MTDVDKKHTYACKQKCQAKDVPIHPLTYVSEISDAGGKAGRDSHGGEAVSITTAGPGRGGV